MDKMLTEERSAFKNLDNMSYALRPIDEKKLVKNLWVQWTEAGQGTGAGSCTIRMKRNYHSVTDADIRSPFSRIIP